MNEEQRIVLLTLRAVIRMAAEIGLMEEVMMNVHPEIVVAFCDGVEAAAKHTETN